MKTRMIARKAGIAILLAGLIAAPTPSQAEEGERPAIGRPGKPSPEEVERLRRLKQENPAEFQRLMQERRQKLQERLAHLKEKDPEAYRRVMGDLAQRRMKRLMELRKSNPEEYERVMAQQRERMEKRREELRQKDPKAYEELMRRQTARRAQMLMRLKRTMKPEAYEKFLKDNPEWAQALKDWEAQQGSAAAAQGGQPPG